MSVIHFKFKNRQDYEKVAIGGLEVSGRELKEAILKKKKIGHSNLDIRDAQTKKVYSDTDMIKRNASVIVMRSVIPNAGKLPKTQHKDPTLLPSAGSDLVLISSSGASDPQKTSDLTSLSGSEEDKLKAMMQQAAEGYTAEDYAKYPVRSGIHPGLFRGPPPRGYVCNRCRKPGHWIQLCPTNGDPAYDRRNQQKELPKISTVGSAKAKHPMPAPKEREMPEELKCPMCKQAMRDAVTIPCCNKSFCDECIREHLLEKDFTCPLCGEEDVSPDSLQPNKDLRESVKQFRSQVAEEKGIVVASLTSRVGFTPHQLSASHLPKPPLTAAAALLERLTARANLSNTTTTVNTVSSGSTAVVDKTLNTTTSSGLESSSQNKPTSVNTDSSIVTAVEEGTTGTTDTPDNKDEGVSGENTTSSDAVSSLAVPEPAGGGRGSPSLSPQQNRSKSPSPSASLEVKKPTRPIVPPRRPPHHSHPKHTLPGFHPSLSMIPGLTAPSLLPLPVMQNQMGLAGINSIPGLGVVQTIPQALPPKDYRAEAEFLLSKTRARPASPPLTADEFYRQQKMLHQFLVRKSPAHSAGPGSTYSHSSDSESAVSDSGTSSESDSDRSVPSLTPSLSPARKKKRRRDHTGSRHHHKKGHHSREMVAREREGSRKHKKRRREMAEDLSDGHRQKKKRRHHRSRRHEKTADSESHLVSSDTATTSDTTHHKKKKKRRRRERDGVDGAAAGVAGEGGLEGEGEGTEMIEEESESPAESLGRERVGGVEVGVAKNPISGEGSPVVSADGDVSEQVNRADGESVNDEGAVVEVEEPAKVVGEGGAGCGTGEEVGVAGRRGSSGDQLLKDIDQLLAVDDDMQPSPSGSGPVGNTPETVARGGEETLGTAAAPAGENSDQEMAEGERDNVSLHVNSDTIDDNTFSGVGNMEGPGANGLEEGEVLSDNGEPGRKKTPNPHSSKPRLRSVASTVQAVNSETPPLIPSDVVEASPGDDGTPSDSSPTPEPEEEEIRVVKHKQHHNRRHHHRHHDRENHTHEVSSSDQKRQKKKRRREKAEEADSSGHHRHKQRKKEREREREREKEREKERERGKKRHRHHKEHRQSS